MSRITLSPSQQPANAYADGSGSEQDHMEAVVSIAADLLRAAGHEVFTPTTGDYRTQVSAGNTRWADGGDLYVAVHSNATGVRGATRRGVESYVMGAGVDPTGYAVAEAITARVAALGIPNRGLLNGSHLYEVNGPVAPSCLVELDYHDTPAGAAWLGSHHADLAAAIAAGTCDVLGGPTAAAAPAPTPAPTTPHKEHTMFLALDVSDDAGRVYLTDGITSRWVQDARTLADLAYLGGQGLIPLATPPDVPGEVADVNGIRVRVVGNRNVLGTIVLEAG